MKNVIGTLVAVAGLAAAANAQTSVFDIQVRSGGGAWGDTLNVNPGDTVEARVLVSYNAGGGAASIGLGSANFQPTISNWTAADAVLPFLASGTSPATGGVEDASGNYGRVLPYAAPGISAASQLIVHQNNVGGVNYARIAQTPTTNWFGQGTLANNLNGSGSITTGQKAPSLTGPSDPAFSNATENLVLFKFAFTVNAASDLRTMVLDLPIGGIRSAANDGTGQRRASWFAASDLFSPSINADADVSGATATVNVVPAPASLALLGLGGLVAGRRRR